MRPAATLVLCLALLLTGCTSVLPGQPSSTSGEAAASRSGSSAEDPARYAPEEDTVTWRGGVHRIGYQPNETAPEAITLAWSLPGINKGTHTAAKSSPLYVDGSWLVPGDTGILYRVSHAGEVLWAAASWPSNNGFHGTPVVHNGTVYLGAYDGALYAFELETGEELWRTRLGGSIGASPLYHEGLIYMAVETPEPSGHVSIVDAQTGEELWRDERITDHPHSSIALDPEADRFVVGANDGLLYAWNTSTRELAWTFETDEPIKGPVAVYAGSAYAGSWDDHVYRVELATGELVWAYETDGNVMGGVAIDPATGILYVGSFDDTVYALDAGTGELVWRRGTGGSVLSSPVIAGDTVLVGSYDEHLYAFNATTGAMVWRYEANGRVSSSAGVGGGQIAFTERADERPGRLYVLEALP